MTTEEPATSTSVEQTLKSLVTRQDVQRTGCRKRREDVMMTDASTATRAGQTERTIRDLGDSGTTILQQFAWLWSTPYAIDFSDQDLESKPDTEMQTGGQEAPVTRKRSAETDAERLEEETAETANADADKRIALKRKAENDLSATRKWKIPR